MALNHDESLARLARRRILRLALEDHGTSQAAVARQLGVTRAAVARVIGGSLTSARIRRHLARMTGIRVAGLWPSRPRRTRARARQPDSPRRREAARPRANGGAK